MCEDILASMRTSDLPGSGSQSVGSELLKIRDPITGRGTLMATCNPGGMLHGQSVIGQMMTSALVCYPCRETALRRSAGGGDRHIPDGRL